MPIKVHQDTIERALAVHGLSPWVWVWYIEADVTTSARTVFQMTNYPKDVDLQVGEPDFKGVYNPYPLQWSEIEEDSEANLPSLRLSFANVMKLPAERLHIGDGFIGHRVFLTILPLDLVNATPGADPFFRQFEIRVASAEATAESVSLRLEAPNFYIRQYPEQRFQPGDCPWKFGLTGGGCPYVRSEQEGYSDCPKTLQACSDRDDDMAARGFPAGMVLEAYGAYPGVADVT